MANVGKKFKIKGLTSQEVEKAREEFGFNRLDYKKENGLVDALKSLAKEPMVILLLVASSIILPQASPSPF